MHHRLRRRLAAVGSIGMMIGLLTAGSANADAAPALVYGVVTAESGNAPLPGTCVELLTTETTIAGQGCADAVGDYHISIAPGTYRLRTAVNGIVRWHSGTVGTPYYPSAASVILTAGSRRIINVPMWGAVGSFKGRILDSAGTPIADRAITIARAPLTTPVWTIRSDAMGGYDTGGMPAGRYRISTGGGSFERDLVIGAATTEDITVPAPAALNVHLVDRVTGLPVLDGCVTVPGKTCVGSGAVRSFTDLVPGKLTITVGKSPTLFATTQEVTLPAGTTTEVTVPVELGSALQVAISSAADPQSHPFTCSNIPMEGSSGAYCSGSDGLLTIGPLRVPTIRLGLVPAAPFGALWVGPGSGPDVGVGDPAQARVFTLTPGRITAGPPISLQPGKSLHGHLTDRFTGKPVVGCVYLPELSNYGYVQTTCADGEYTISGLGAYRWAFDATGGSAYAPVTSSASPGATDVDLTLQPGGRIEGVVRDGIGRPVDASIGAVSPAGKQLAWMQVNAYMAPFNLGGLPAGPVLLRVTVGATTCWFSNAGQPFQAALGETLRIDPLIMAPDCATTLASSMKAAS
ncbi:hypothetical protein F4553_004355 [Allocatelliglobosispora scoriae]|uniref:Alpha-amylase n=1 Tax=Allocatelliglobosispora scoriae TaxID=643052 RepID=A0A841BU58_9ACTN|nr:carboxypeptidase-like regulatory domain-containing protein [Allocatelliglobosispora scoriae]MBB5870976.1 hypothetical protein [Allocatelliglobosispora scoriae]